MTGWLMLACAGSVAVGCAPATRLTVQESAPTPAQRCDPGKQTCKQMRDCEEALYYLRECGVSRLDKDKDGVPCESLCLR